MATRGSFLYRTDPRVLEALRRWAGDELRSANGQLDYLVRKALIESGRLKTEQESQETDGEAADD